MVSGRRLQTAIIGVALLAVALLWEAGAFASEHGGWSEP